MRALARAARRKQLRLYLIPKPGAEGLSCASTLLSRRKSKTALEEMTVGLEFRASTVAP